MIHPIVKRSLLALALTILFGSVAAQTPRQSITWDNVQREYLVHVPTQHTEGTPLPLLFFMHGLGGDISRYDSWYDLQTAADQYGWIIVLPQALPYTIDYIGYPFDLGSTWNAGIEVTIGELHYALNSEVDDAGFLMALIDTLDSQYTIDHDSIFFSGISMGGFMTHRMAIEHGDRIAGFGAISGLIALPLADRNPVNPVNMLHIHGTDDEVISYYGYLNVPLLGEIKMGISVDSVIDYWVSHDHCNPTPTIDSMPDRIDDGMRFVRYSYDEGEQNSHVQFLKVIGGQHEWYVDEMQYDVDYMVELHEFFCRHQPHYSCIDESPISNLNVYPNPATDRVNITAHQPSELYIYNIQGKLISSYHLEAGNNTIDITSLHSGLYLFRTTNDTIQKINIISNHE